ncbi:uncharacterized protein LOC110869950 [Helianthus annuus]|uniref:uncharacterized protein LOC110869950 n=1 Tax=Helianthus annuus TaxID=4232 RepID=UPI000B8F713A|nr:uncharacterized protein LOC110869950 [Helianthus annuus]
MDDSYRNVKKDGWVKRFKYFVSLQNETLEELENRYGVLLEYLKEHEIFLSDGEKIEKFADALPVEWSECLENLRKDSSFSKLHLNKFISKLKTHEVESRKKRKDMIKVLENHVLGLGLDVIEEMCTVRANEKEASSAEESAKIALSNCETVCSKCDSFKTDYDKLLNAESLTSKVKELEVEKQTDEKQILNETLEELENRYGVLLEYLKEHEIFLSDGEKIEKFADALPVEWSECLENLRKDSNFSKLHLNKFISKLKTHEVESRKKRKDMIKVLENHVLGLGLDVIEEMIKRIVECVRAKYVMKYDFKRGTVRANEKEASSAEESAKFALSNCETVCSKCDSFKTDYDKLLKNAESLTSKVKELEVEKQTDEKQILNKSEPPRLKQTEDNRDKSRALAVIYDDEGYDCSKEVLPEEDEVGYAFMASNDDPIPWKDDRTDNRSTVIEKRLLKTES